MLRQAASLYPRARFHFLELSPIPGSFSSLEELSFLKKMPVTVHSPHCREGFNIFNLDKGAVKMFSELAKKSADFFAAKHIIVHAGRGGDREIFKKNIAEIKDKRILIENMAKLTWDFDKQGNFTKNENDVCFGYSKEQLLFIKQECGFDICFDFGHAIKAAVSQGLDYHFFVEDLSKELKPTYFHLCDGDAKEERDEHLNLGEGDFPLSFIKKILQQLAEEKDIDLVFEVPKQGDTLNNDLKNIDYFASL